MRRAIVIGRTWSSCGNFGCSASALYYEDRHWPMPQKDYEKRSASSAKDELRHRPGVPYSLIADECAKDEYGCNYGVYVVDGRDPKNKIPDGKKFGEFNQWSYTQRLLMTKRLGILEFSSICKVKT